MDANRPRDQVAAVPTSLPFRAVLAPHRSLSRRGFIIVMLVLSGVSFAAGIVFTLIGAWPVLGFFGLDVVLVYVAFKLNYRAARARETIEITRDDLTVTRISANGGTSEIATLSATWVRLDEREAPDGSVDLALTSRGRRVTIARDLGSDERRDLATALRAALRLVREPELPSGTV